MRRLTRRLRAALAPRPSAADVAAAAVARLESAAERLDLAAERLAAYLAAADALAGGAR